MDLTEIANAIRSNPKWRAYKAKWDNNPNADSRNPEYVREAKEMTAEINSLVFGTEDKNGNN